MYTEDSTNNIQRERERDLVHKGTTKNEYDTTSTVMYHDEIAYIFEVKKKWKIIIRNVTYECRRYHLCWG